MNSRGEYKGYWPKASIERRKLSNKENDWNLVKGDGVTSRTRGGGKGRASKLVQTEMRKLEWLDPESSASEREDDDESADDSSYEDEMEEDEELEYDVKDTKKVAPPTRAIVEIDALVDGFEKNCRCMDCHGPVQASIESICLASSFMLSCKDERCGYVYHSNPTSMARIPAPDNRE
jgi:hypothetical protein